MEKLSRLKVAKQKVRVISYLLVNLNIVKTIWINFKMFPFQKAILFPVFIFGRAHLKLRGRFIIDCDLKPGLLKFGYKYEMNKKELGVAELLVSGTFILKGEVWFGMDCFVNVLEGATLSMGHFSSLGCRGRIICTRNIIFSDYARIGYESVVSDSNFHYIKDMKTNLIADRSGSILLGSYNYIGGRVLINKNTITPDYCIVSANSLCNRDYSQIIPQYSMIGGMPARLIKSNCMRIFDSNKEKRIERIFNERKEPFLEDFSI